MQTLFLPAPYGFGELWLQTFEHTVRCSLASKAIDTEIPFQMLAANIFTRLKTARFEAWEEVLKNVIQKLVICDSVLQNIANPGTAWNTFQHFNDIL